MNCFCDHFCVYFQDCCPDAMINKQYIQNTVDVSKELIDCVKIEQVSSVNAVYAVNRCPATWSGPETRAKCEKFTGRDLLLHLTVTGVNTGLTYKNMYCAMCHETEYCYWIPSVSCNSRQPVYDSIRPNATIREALAYPGCDLKFLPPNDTISYRSCLPHNIVDKCDKQFNETSISEICENSESMEMVYSVDKAWRNPSCAVCNFESRISCEMLFPVSTSNQFKKRRGFYSFSILIDMNTRKASSTVGTRFKKITRNVTEIYTCHDNEVYDPFSLHCRRVVCDAPFVYRNGLCRTNKSETEAGNVTDCPRIQLDEMEYSILEDGTLLEIASGRRYDEQQYFVKGLLAFVCSYLTQNYTNTTVVEEVVMVLTFSLSEAIVSVVGLCISLIGLLVTIVTYAVIKSLQNIPGKNLLSLSSSLFIAELLMIIAPSAEGVFVLCKGIGVCMHYFFLVAFFWMNVMAADVWFTFSKSFVKAGGSGKSSKRFYFYSVYSWGVPFLILVLSLLVDTFLTDSTFKPDYGMGLCWFTKKNALMVFFAMPLFLIILMNIIFFAIASKNIYEARRSSARYLQTSENSSPFLYMKLFFVMGLTWIVGFLASLVARAVLWYLFAILNTLQGFFIFLSFVATKKVLHLILAHLRTLRTGQANETNQPSSPTRSTFVPFKISSSRTVV
ncbi:G-protein coupled receptor Mth2-like [Gigantopelta aegis]|uniref:G-protein coupled receptor Mth2-like n=1 Tax=Gigantopelta aegis TaxID=1735272 RepID=UPI001B889FCE|nr:G-protein coupled receptor Mth2-like [Gigantopelta aegis]